MVLSRFMFLLIFLLDITFTEQVEIQCLSLNQTKSNFCYSYTDNSVSWLDAYNHCLTKTLDGILIQVTSNEQFDLLKIVAIDKTTPFWLGANNFASYFDSYWHWIDGSIVNNSMITWCPHSTYKTANGTQCAAYDSTLQCVDNYLCNTLLPAPCVSGSYSNQQLHMRLIPETKAIDSCTSSSGGVYAHWWTYSVLLLNWFILFCFFLYLCNRFTLKKPTAIITVVLILLSFMLIVTFAILWGIQYQDIIQIPLATVIIGCVANILIFIILAIVLSDSTHVQRFTACIILTYSTIIMECLLMLGLILCVAYCSAYITLSWTSLYKDVIASLLASLAVAITILFHTSILYLLENDGQDRIHAVKPEQDNMIPLAHTHTPVNYHASQAHIQSNNHRPSGASTVKKHEQIERATSPVDERVLNQFYTDRPSQVHEYKLEGRQFIIYEGVNPTDIDSYRKDLTQAMLLQESQGLYEAIDRAKNSIHAQDLTHEIHQAQTLVTKLV